MQTQEISKITINGLFHKYDVTVDLSKDCTILIGSNGIGKSTVLKLIKYLLSGMIMDVATVPFDSIVIDGCAMQHEDFLIPTHILETLFCELNSQVDDCGFSLNEDVTIFRSQNEIRLDKLSSGESKIIALCFLALCSDYAILILDEPELSISIIWQEKLLVDLLDYGTFTSIVVATHSPYIARHETLSEYINYLP